MIRETASMMFLTTRTETEALLLEQNLIKQLKPKFNVLLRDDKSFPNILVTGDHAYPMIKKHRGAKKEKGAYYGPFASAGAVNRTLNQLQKVFLLRNCTDSMFESRTRPCLLHQIKRCSAPCVGKISEEDYAESVRDAERFLSGRTTQIQETLAKQMAGGLRGDGIRARRGPARPDPRDDAGADGAGDQPARRDRGGYHRAAHGERAGLRAGLLHPGEPELGQPRFLSARRRRMWTRPRCSRPSSASSTTPRSRRGCCCCPTRSRIPT